MSEQRMILHTSDEAARFVENISGWVSRDGLFFGKDERTARWSGATHVECEDCGAPTPKGHVACDACSEIRDQKRYDAREKKPWDGVSMVYSEVADRYFEDEGALLDWCQDEERDPKGLRIILCEPNYARGIDTDHWSDDLPEEGDLPADLLAALDEFNEVIREGKFILSWSPGKYAVEL